MERHYVVIVVVDFAEVQDFEAEAHGGIAMVEDLSVVVPD